MKNEKIGLIIATIILHFFLINSISAQNLNKVQLSNFLRADVKNITLQLKPVKSKDPFSQALNFMDDILSGQATTNSLNSLKAISDTSKSSFQDYVIGLYYFTKDDIGQAEKYLNESYRKSDTSLSALQLLGGIHYENSNYQKAVKVFTEYTQKLPSNHYMKGIVTKKLGLSHYQLGNNKEALFYLKDSLNYNLSRSDEYAIYSIITYLENIIQDK